MSTQESVWRVLREETEKRKRANRSLKAVIIGLISLSVVVTAISWWRTGRFDLTLATSQFALIACGATVGLTPRLKGAILALADEPDALPYLVDALDSADKEVVPLATDLLTRKLGQVREEDVALFGPERVAALARSLTTSSNAEFTVAVLGAMRYIGSGNELGAVDLVAKGHQMNMAKAHKERLSQLGLSAAADMRMRLARSVIESKSQEAASGVERATAGLPSTESAPESDEVRLRA